MILRAKYLSYIPVILIAMIHDAQATLQWVVTGSVNQAVTSVDWSYDDRFVAVGCKTETGGKEVQIYRWQTNSMVLTNSVTTNRTVNSVGFGKTALHFAYGFEKDVSEPEFYVHNVSTNGRFLTTNAVEYGIDVTAVAWRPNNLQVAVGTASSTANPNEVNIYSFTGSTNSLSRLHTNNISGNQQVIPNGIVWHPDEKRYGVAYKSTTTFEVDVYSNTSGNAYASGASLSFNALFDVNSIDWYSSGSNFALGLGSITQTNRLRLYRMSATQSFSYLTNATIPDDDKDVYAVAWAGFNNVLAVGMEGALRVYRVNDQGGGSIELLYDENLAAGTHLVKALSWSKDSRYLAVGIDEGLFSGSTRIYKLLSADLAVRKTNSPALARPGSNLVYTITVTNAGPDTLNTPLTIYDTLPTGVTHVASTSTYGGVITVTGQIVTVTYPSFNVNSSATISITALVDSSLRTILTNKVSLRALMSDPNIANNTNTLLTFTDYDGDGIPDITDKCPEVASPDNGDTDGDGIGNPCDNCPSIINTNQSDIDLDGVGDLCDNCPSISNTNQLDSDGDTLGNACDPCPFVFGPGSGTDSDGDGIDDACDNCLNTMNPDQLDTDLDGVGNACDNCVDDANPSQSDLDSDDVGDACDVCPTVPNDGADLDGDNIPDDCDPDKDGDLLPNDWEILYGFNPANDSIFDWETNLNPDLDEYSNVEEYIAGTIPTDPASTPAYSAIQPGGGVQITWPILTGRIYDVFYATNMMDDSWNLLTSGLSGTGSTLTLSLTNTWLERYFRYDIQMAP